MLHPVTLRPPKTVEEKKIDALVAAQITTIVGTLPFVLSMLDLFSVVHSNDRPRLYTNSKYVCLNSRRL